MRRVAVACGLIVLLLVGLYASRLRVLPLAVSYLDVGSRPERVDFVMALPGDPDFRPFVAAAIVKAGLADQALIPKNTESPDVIDGVVPPNYEVTRRIYRARNVEEDRIVVLDGATESTADDLELLAGHLDRRLNSTACVVTSAFHTRRTRWTIQERFPDLADRITVVSAPNPSFDTETWWRSDEGFVMVLSEYVKLMIYWLQYGNGLFWIGGFGVMAIGGVCLVRRNGGRNLTGAAIPPKKGASRLNRRKQRERS